MKCFAALAVLLVMASSCVSFSSMQNARTVKEGDVIVALGAGTQSMKFKEYSDDASEKEQQEALEKLSMPVLEGGVRYGVKQNFDVGGKISLLPGTLALSGKYMFYGHGTPAALATGLDIAYGSFSFSSGANDESKATLRIVDTTIPFFTSYDPADWVSLYLTPRAGLRFVSSESKSDVTGESTSDSNSAGIWGANVGMILGFFAAEYSMLSFNGDSDAFLQQIMLGVVIGMDKLEK